MRHRNDQKPARRRPRVPAPANPSSSTTEIGNPAMLAPIRDDRPGEDSPAAGAVSELFAAGSSHANLEFGVVLRGHWSRTLARRL